MSRSSSRSRSRSYSPSRPPKTEKSEDEKSTKEPLVKEVPKNAQDENANNEKSIIDTKDRKLQDREAPETSNVLAIFNLNLQTTEDDLRKELGKHGTVTHCRIVMDQKRNKSRGFAFVTFENEEMAIKAKTHAHGMTLNEKEIRVDYSITRRAHSPTPGVYMGHKGKEKLEGSKENGAKESNRPKVIKRELSISPDRPAVKGYRSRSGSPVEGNEHINELKKTALMSRERKRSKSRENQRAARARSRSRDKSRRRSRSGERSRKRSRSRDRSRRKSRSRDRRSRSRDRRSRSRDRRSKSRGRRSKSRGRRSRSREKRRTRSRSRTRRSRSRDRRKKSRSNSRERRRSRSRDRKRRRSRS